MGALDIIFHKGWEDMKPHEKAVIYISGILGGLVILLTIIYLFQAITTPHSQEVAVHIDVSGGVISNKSSTTNQVNLSNEGLRSQTLDLAKNISKFKNDRDIEEMDSIPFFKTHSSNYDANNPDSNLNDWINNTNNRRVFEAKTMNIFDDKYLSDVIWTRNEFQKHNLTDPELNRLIDYNRIDYPTDIKDVSTRLQILAYKLP